MGTDSGWRIIFDANGVYDCVQETMVLAAMESGVCWFTLGAPLPFLWSLLTAFLLPVALVRDGVAWAIRRARSMTLSL